MKAPLILIAAVFFVAAVAAVLLFGARIVSVSSTVVTNSVPIRPLSSAQAQTGLLEVVSPAAEPPPSPAPPIPQDVVGIGAIIKRNNATGENMITGVVPDSPAAAAGLAGAFIIRKIDDTSADGLSLQECVGLIRGPTGTKVRLELFDVEANELRNIELTRQRLQLRPSQQPQLK